MIGGRKKIFPWYVLRETQKTGGHKARYNSRISSALLQLAAFNAHTKLTKDLLKTNIQDAITQPIMKLHANYIDCRIGMIVQNTPVYYFDCISYASKTT